MTTKNQSDRLTHQHRKHGGVEGIFGDEAKLHDASVGYVSKILLKWLRNKYPSLSFRHRSFVTKKEINTALKKIDKNLGQTQFLDNSRIKPDGGIIEVKDDNDEWRIILVSEAKHQGKDIDNIRKGILVGKNKDQDLMVAGNAIERSFKNIKEIANLMISESHFPYILFLEGSNFLTKTINVERPDGRVVTIENNRASLNRLDRLTAANYGLPINTNLCENRFVQHKDKTIMLQATSIYTSGDGSKWNRKKMLDIMIEVSETSLKMLGTDLFKQLT